MTIPTAQDIAPFGTLDEINAREQFLGKSFSEAVAMFADNALLYGDSLLHMGEKAALFYGSALLHHVNSEESRGDVEAASALVSATDCWLGTGFDLSSVEDQLIQALTKIHEQLSFYAPDDLTQRIYQDLPKRARHALRGISRRKQA